MAKIQSEGNKGPLKQQKVKGGKQESKIIQGPPPSNHRDLFHRVNFTYQASIFLQNLQDLTPNQPGPSRYQKGMSDFHPPENLLTDRKGKRNAVGVDAEVVDRGGDEVGPELGLLARNATRMTKKLVAHNQLKLDPSLKRSICKTCSTILVPGLTSRIRTRPSKNHLNVINHACLKCGGILSIPTPPVKVSLDVSEGSTILSGGASALDGPVRAKRRRKVAERRKPPFFEREKPRDEKHSGADAGHELWRGSEKLHDWGTVVGCAANDGYRKKD